LGNSECQKNKRTWKQETYEKILQSCSIRFAPVWKLQTRAAVSRLSGRKSPDRKLKE
jgi:hypothetical protein